MEGGKRDARVRQSFRVKSIKDVMACILVSSLGEVSHV